MLLVWNFGMWRKDHLLYKNNKDFKGERDIIQFLAEDCLQLCVPISRPSIGNDHSYISINEQKDSEEGDHRYFIEEVPCIICDKIIPSDKTKSHYHTHTIFYCTKCKNMFNGNCITTHSEACSDQKSYNCQECSFSAKSLKGIME